MRLAHESARSYASSINAGDLEETIQHHIGLCQTHFKLKVSFGEHGNREIVEWAAEVCPAGTRIMIEANQSWSPQKSKTCLEALERLSPFFAEEVLPADAPLHGWENLAWSTRIHFAGGKNNYGIDEFRAMASAGLHFLQPDVAKWGGVTGSLDLAAILPRGVRLWPRFMGTGVGQMAVLSISVTLGDEYACKIDVNNYSLRTELCGNAVTIHDGLVNLPTDPGLVIPPDPN